MIALLLGRHRHRWFHRLDVTSVDFGNYRSARCRRCGRRFQQRLIWATPDGPWREDVRAPCEHGTDGQPIPACMSCAVDRQNWGLA